MRDKDYWESRMTNSILESERSVLDYEKKLLEAYDYAYVQIKKEIESFF